MIGGAEREIEAEHRLLRDYGLAQGESPFLFIKLKRRPYNSCISTFIQAQLRGQLIQSLRGGTPGSEFPGQQIPSRPGEEKTLTKRVLERCVRLLIDMLLLINACI
jgi:hypothetical protein